MGRAGRRGREEGAGEESKREAPPHDASASSSNSSSTLPLPLRYHHPAEQRLYGVTTTYQSLETAAAATAVNDDDGPSISRLPSSSRLSPFGGGRRLLAPAGLFLHGGALVAVGLLCGLGVGVLIGRGGGGAAPSSLMGARVGAGGAGLPVLGNSFSPQVCFCVYVCMRGGDWIGGLGMMGDRIELLNRSLFTFHIHLT